MGILSAGDLKPGMILEGDVKDLNGRFLIGKGTQLTPKHISTLNAWGVLEASIAGTAGQEVHRAQRHPAGDDIFKAATRLTTERFLHLDPEDAFVCELFDLCLQRKIKAIEADPDSLQPENLTLPLPNAVCDVLPEAVDPTDLIRQKIKLPTLPNVFFQINEALSDPDSSVTLIAGLIEKDSTISARLLRMANSAFFGFPHRIDSIAKAVALIGARQLSALIWGIYATEAFKDIPSEFIDMRSFWKHCLTCGIIARLLSSYRSGKFTEKHFLTGLLHDIGRLVLVASLPHLTNEILRKAYLSQSTVTSAEESLLGFNHASLGGLLCRKWHFPKPLEDAVKNHHQPMAADNPADACIVHVADIIANAIEAGCSGERFVPELEPGAWEALELPTGVLRSVLQQVDQRVAEQAHIFLSDEPK